MRSDGDETVKPLSLASRGVLWGRFIEEEQGKQELQHNTKESERDRNERKARRHDERERERERKAKTKRQRSDRRGDAFRRAEVAWFEKISAGPPSSREAPCSEKRQAS